MTLHAKVGDRRRSWPVPTDDAGWLRCQAEAWTDAMAVRHGAEECALFGWDDPDWMLADYREFGDRGPYGLLVEELRLVQWCCGD